MKKLLILLVLSIFLISLVSALELNPFATSDTQVTDIKVIDSDFLKTDFNAEYGVIRLSNTFFWIETDKIAEYSLTSNTKQCFKNCRLEGKAILYGDGTLFEDANFKDIQGKETELEYSQYFIKVNNGYDETKCKYDEKNVSTSCDTTTTFVDEWEVYNGEVLKAGNYEWELRGSKYFNTPIDAIPLAFGKEFTEWAWWDATTTYEDTASAHATAIGSGSATLSVATGMKIKAVGNTSLVGITQITTGSVHPTKCYILNASKFVLTTGDFAAGNVSCNFTIPYNITKDGVYYLFVNKTAGSYTQRYGAATLSVTSGLINWTHGVNEVPAEATNEVHMVLTAIYRTYTTTSATYGVMANKNSPINGYNTTSTTPTFNCSFEAFNGIDILNTSLMIWNASNYQSYFNTNITPYNSTNMSYTWTSSTLIDGTYKWNCWANNRNNTYNATGGGLLNRTFTIDNTPPFVNLTYPLSQTYIDGYVYQNNKTIQINWTTSDLNAGNCFLFNGTANNSVICYTNVSYQNITYNKNTTYIIFSNDTGGNINSSSVNFMWVYTLLHNSFNYNTTIYETENIELKINVSSSSTLTSAALFWNQTSYGTTITSTGGSYIFNRTIQVPLMGSEINISSYWIFSNSSSTINSSFINQTVKNITFSLCNSTGDDFLNITFADEGDSSILNASISTSSFVYYMGDGTINKTYSYINNSNNYYYKFCFLPVDRTIYVNPIVQYKSTDYPQRIYEPSTLTLTNTSTVKVLYLLSTTDGLYVTFQVINSAQQTLSGVEVTVTRVIGSETTIIGTGTTDAAGSVTFWLNPDFSHTITFEKTGYETYSTSITPTQSSYTITLGGTTTTTPSDCRTGISYSISPLFDFLDNNTNYNFNFTIVSSNLSLSAYGFNLYYSNGTLIGTESGSTSTGGFLDITPVNSYNSSGIYLDYYYTITSCDTVNGTRVWTIQSTEGREFSISHFFDDLILYIGVGMFGFDDFGKGLISFIIIFLVVGGIGYGYGMRSEAALFGILFGIVFFFDTIGFLPEISLAGGIVPKEHFITIVTGFILFALLVREQNK